MKIPLIGACAVALLAAGAAHAQGDKVELVSGGVVCDKGDQVCYDQRGANVERTRDMFRQYAAQDVQKRLGKKDDWGTKKFTLSNGVKEEGEGERSKKITKHLFQAPAPQPR
jgi:hypothetical protein